MVLILGWIIISLLDFAITWFFDPSRIRTFFCIEIDEDSILLSDEYEYDRNRNGGWKIKIEAPDEIFAFVSTKRAYEFLLYKLKVDNEDLLRYRIIKARKGVHLAKTPRSHFGMKSW